MLNQKNEENETTVSSTETKKNRLILDLEILSSLNNKSKNQLNQYISHKCSTDTDTENSKRKQTTSVFSFLKENLDNEQNYQFLNEISSLKENLDYEQNHQILNENNNQINLLGNNYTNFTYYKEPLNCENTNNSRYNSAMSYNNLNIPGLYKTNESYYINFLQPIKHDTNEFINQKRNSDLFFYNSFPFLDNIVNENFQKNLLDNKNIKKNKDIKFNNEKIKVLFKTKKGKKTNNKFSINSGRNINNLYKCEHLGCEGTFCTKKLLLAHHKKFSPQCQSDTILILELINYMKKIIKNNNLKNNIEKLKERYNNIMKNISLEEHVQLISGLTFD